MVVEDIDSRHENVEFGFKIKKELQEDEKEMLKNMPYIQKLDRTRLPCLRKVEKGKRFTEVRKVNELLKKIELKDVTEDNDLFYLGVALVTNVFEKTKTKGERRQPWWKRRLESQVKELNKDLGRLHALLKGKKMKKKHQDNLQKRYKLKEKEKPKVKGEILQRINVKTGKINRYHQRVSQFQENRFFRNNEGRFYKQIDGSEEDEEIVVLHAQEAKTFWTDIWGQEVEHNKDATWLREIKKDMNGKNKQAREQISQEKLKKILKKIPNWKAPGPDRAQGLWSKNFTSLHKNIVWNLNACLEGETARWMPKERTVLIQNDKSQGNEACN